MLGYPTRPSLSIASLLLLAASPALAQHCSERACTATNTVSVHVGTVLRLGVQGSTMVLASSAVVGLGPTAVVRSNGTWRLQVSAAQDTWTPVDGAARSDKPASDLTISTSPTDGFASMSTTPADVARGGPTSGATLPLYYRTQFTAASDAPGTYSLTVRLTLVGA